MAEMMGRMDEVIFHAMVTNVGPRGMRIQRWKEHIWLINLVREFECFGL